MESFVPSVTIESTTTNLSSKTLKELFEKGMKHLKDHASYDFASPKREPTSWAIAYWAMMLSRSHTGSDCVPTRNLLLFWIARIMGYDSIC